MAMANHLKEMYGLTDLHLVNSERDLIDLIHNKGLDPNVKSKILGLTSLHTCEDPAIASLLIENGAQIDVKTNGGVYPISFKPFNIPRNQMLIRYGSLMNHQEGNKNPLYKNWLLILLYLVLN